MRDKKNGECADFSRDSQLKTATEPPEVGTPSSPQPRFEAARPHCQDDPILLHSYKNTESPESRCQPNISDLVGSRTLGSFRLEPSEADTSRCSEVAQPGPEHEEVLLAVVVGCSDRGGAGDGGGCG